MKHYNLRIAGYIIRFKASADGPELAVSQRFLRYITKAVSPDIEIKVHSGSFDLPEKAEKVFHAPFSEEIGGTIVHHTSEFWSVWQADSCLLIKTCFPQSPKTKNATLRFSLSEKEWDLWIESDSKVTDPFEYPLDGLILYYLTVISGDLFIHASGVSYAGKGFLFTGVSGKGKSTIANLWENYGAIVIHDDRLIIRKTGKSYTMFNTPVYDNEEPVESSLDRIFIIEHGNENHLIPLTESAAVSQVMSNCIQHAWSRYVISGLLRSVSDMCNEIPSLRLQFRPDQSVIDYILKKNEQPG